MKNRSKRRGVTVYGVVFVEEMKNGFRNVCMYLVERKIN